MASSIDLGTIIFGAVVLIGGPIAASLSPWLVNQKWWPWKGNRKGGG